MHYIYKITNLINHKVYIGQAKDIKQRWRQHKAEAKKEKPSMIINQAMKKYGIDNFIFEVIASCLDLDAANDAETIIVSQQESHISLGKGYNVSNGGSNAPKTEDWKKMMREKFAGIPTGRPTVHSEETKQKLSQQKTEFYQKRLQEIGVKMTEEERQKLSTSHLGKSSPRKGTTCSEESRLKMSRAQTGKKASEETKRKKSEAMKAICENNPDFVETIRARSTGRFKLNKDQEAEICALYQGGLTSRQLGEKFVVSPTTICSILRRNNKLHE